MSHKQNAIACDRVLLYARGLGVEPVRAVELALESLRRAGSGADTQAVMHQLEALLAENNMELRLTDSEGRTLRSAPPMNRRTMVTEGMDTPPVFPFFKRFRRPRGGRT